MPKTQVQICYLLAASILGSSSAWAQTASQPAAPTKPIRPKQVKYQKQEPLTDSSLQESERQRLRRPGDDGSDDSAAPPTAPNLAGNMPSPSPAPMPLYKAPPTAPPAERFPTVGQLETMMFGKSNPGLVVETRLDRLENSVFQKSFPEQDTETRIHKLRDILVGGAAGSPASAPRYPAQPDPDPYAQAPYQQPAYQSDYKPRVEEQEPERKAPFFENSQNFDLKAELPVAELEKFALIVVNEARANRGLPPLAWDNLAGKVATEMVQDLGQRSVVSHHNSKGDNPDVRYTKAGGTSAMEECLIMFTSAQHIKPTRELVVKMLEHLASRQDDVDALLNPHATGFGLSFGWSKDRARLICCSEIVSAHGELDPLPLEVAVGEKVDVKGTIAGPYQFQKITLAWEGDQPVLPDDGEESAEAVPYFPPLDYEAHAAKSEKDWDKGIRMLQIAGITAAIAGGFFMPPVALAAPLIAASAGTPKVKAVSDIPIKGGVKTDGSSFAHKVPLNHDGKEGIYYITVWAKINDSDQPVAVSRRAIIARKAQEDPSSSPKREGKNKKETEGNKNEES